MCCVLLFVRNSLCCVVLCCVVLCCVVLCCVVLCCVVLCCVVLCCVVLCCVVLCCVVLCCAVLCCVVWCVVWCGVWCGVVWCGVVLWCVVWCCVALCFVVLLATNATFFYWTINQPISQNPNRPMPHCLIEPTTNQTISHKPQTPHCLIRPSIKQSINNQLINQPQATNVVFCLCRRWVEQHTLLILVLKPPSVTTQGGPNP